MPKFIITEEQVIRVDYHVEARNEAEARDLVNAMNATDYDQFNTLISHEVVLVQTED